MAVSKILVVKSFAAVSATSVLGTGAANFFQTKDINKQIQDEIKKKFLNKNNRQVLEIAGFKDASTNRDILRKSLELRLTSEKVQDGLIDKLVSFCEEGMTSYFEGITDVYKTLATVCTRTITLENKVARDKLRLSSQSDVSEKLSLISDKHRQREFVKSFADGENAKSLLEACAKLGSKDVFSFEISKDMLADYMTFCVEEKPSVIRFWTGINDPADVADYWEKVEAEELAERQKREKEQQEAEEAEKQRLLALEEQRVQAEKQKQEEEQKRIEAQKQADALKAKEEEQRIAEAKKKEEQEREDALKAQKEKEAEQERQRQKEAEDARQKQLALEEEKRKQQQREEEEKAKQKLKEEQEARERQEAEEKRKALAAAAEAERQKQADALKAQQEKQRQAQEAAALAEKQKQARAAGRNNIKSKIIRRLGAGSF